MNDRPIICSAPAVTALLSGRKTQMRCLPSMWNCAVNGGSAFHEKFLWRHLDWSQAFVDPGPSPAGNAGPYWKVPFVGSDESGDGYEGTVHRIYPLFFPNQRLWVREALMLRAGRAAYAADAAPVSRPEWIKTYPGAPCLASRMPRRVSRITLTIGEVRLERLWEISDADLVEEGIGEGEQSLPPTRAAFARFWDEHCGRGAGFWDANPWVIALSFVVAPENIDRGRQEV